MTVTIELPPDIAANWAVQARAHGLDLTQYLEQLLKEQAPNRAVQQRSPVECANAWRDFSLGLPDTPPLSDEAISRESIYGDRGQ